MTDAASVDPETVFGPEALGLLAPFLRGRGIERVLVISGPSRRFVDRVTRALEGFSVSVFDEAAVHVPVAVVDAAARALADGDAEAVVAVGGGAAIGVAKALRMRDPMPAFAAVPTTYAGSEMTSIWGVTDAGDKKTSRDDRVRPDLVLYDPALTVGMPLTLTIQSLFNALAHPIAAIAGASDARPEIRDAAAAAIRDAFEAAHALVSRPRSLPARRLAQRAASAAARTLDAGAPAEHHRVAHVLGGRFSVPHAALHAVLLPGSLHALHRRAPEHFARIAQAAEDPDPSAALHDLLRRAGAPTSLRELGLEPEPTAAALREAGLHAALDWVHAVQLGRRLSVRTRYPEWIEGAPPLSVRGPEPRTARRIVVAIHGRQSNADEIVRRASELLGDDPHTTIVAPQSDTGVWSQASYREPAAAHGDALPAALARIDATFAHLRAQAPGVPIHLFGFSQGACFALEYAATTAIAPASVIAIAGARIGPAEAWTRPVALRGVPCLLGVAHHDRWLPVDDVRAAWAHLSEAGARAELVLVPGDAHEIALVQRIRAREIVLGRDDRRGQPGFGNAHESEAWEGVVPKAQNSPRRPAFGLYAEQVSGTGFVAPRATNKRVWLYRVRPSAGRSSMRALEHPTFGGGFLDRPAAIDLVGHRALPIPSVPTDFVDGLHTYGGAGDPALRRGFAIHLYCANRSMEHRAFYDADGDLLILPQHGRLSILSELGVLDVAPGHLAIVPRGLLFSVLLHDDFARGFVGETFGRHFELPERGPVGANGLADARHFRAPTAWFHDQLDPGASIVGKLGGRLFHTEVDHSPFDVVGWHGNYTPYAYDLASFSPLSTVRRDHADPSIYTVLTSPLDETGSHGLDLVIFPPRWDATEGTFRPPFFHRNAITEFNGIIRERDRGDSPFQPGMCFLTPCMTPHGVLADTVDRNVGLDDRQADRPQRIADYPLWFQFETALPISLSPWALAAPERIDDWDAAWGRYSTYYDPGRRDPF
jgi:homogentisate 1,2-dioxygenase